MIIDSVAMRLIWLCPFCRSEDIHAVWSCEKPEIVSYDCQDCKKQWEADKNGILLNSGTR